MTINVSHAQTVKIVGTGTATCATFELDFLREYCTARPQQTYADAAETLYVRLRGLQRDK